jgi:DNA polymerase sigma
MDALYQRSKLPELGARLRYFISSQIEDTISGIFPCNRVYLFGSSVNGFGHRNSDVDMILDFDVGHTEKVSEKYQQNPYDCELSTIWFFSQFFQFCSFY